jgi:hypothetical protein
MIYNFQPLTYKSYIEKLECSDLCGNTRSYKSSGGKNSDKKKLAVAMEGLESSPGCGCVTSAPNMMVGMSLTNGILHESASTKIVFRPLTCPPSKPVTHE